MGKTQIIGAAGERAAENWLTRNDFEVIARNWRSGHYELDIVARRGRALHFIEVKTRDEESWESPEDAMNHAKQRSFRKAAVAYLAQHPSELEPQLDLIAVDISSDGQYTVRHIPEAVINRW